MAGQVTIWEQASQAILALLNAPGPMAVAYRDRFEAVGQSEIAFNVFSTKIDIGYDCDQRAAHVEAIITVRLCVAGTAGDPDATPPVPAVPVSTVADPLVLYAWKVICADPTLGQLVTDTYPGEIETGFVDKSSSDQVCVDISFHVNVEVGRFDPSINMTFMGL
jgi:hypothetical protein